MREDRIDFVNGVGILFVVLGHYGSYISTNDWFTWIWSWHMPLFFMTSGYLFYKKEDGYFFAWICQLYFKKCKEYFETIFDFCSDIYFIKRSDVEGIWCN